MKLQRMLLVVSGILLIGMAAVAKDVKVNYSQLPHPVKYFLAKHFAGNRIQSITIDMDDATPEYEVTLQNGTEIDISPEGIWSEVSNDNDAILVTMLPETVQIFVQANHPNDKVVKAEQDNRGYEVELSNGMELIFDTNGEYVALAD